MNSPSKTQNSIRPTIAGRRLAALPRDDTCPLTKLTEGHAISRKCLPPIGSKGSEAIYVPFESRIGMHFQKRLPYPLTKLTEGYAISRMRVPPYLTKLTKGASVSFVSAMGRHFCKKVVDGLRPVRYSEKVTEKDVAGCGSPNKEADNRQQAVFFRPNHAVPSMGGGGGEASAYRFLLSGLPTLLFAALPVWKRGGGLTAKEGGSHAWH